MLKNYLTTAFRNLWREKDKTALNILGLTVGIAGSLILFLLVRYHNSFDVNHSKGDRIYRVVTMSDGNNGKSYTAGVPSVLAEAFKNDFPEAEEVLFTSYRANSLITIPQGSGEPKRFEEDRGITFAQPSYFKIFDRKILSGDAKNGLSQPNEAILSKKWAVKYFGKEDALGEILEHDKIQYKVTAIMEDAPTNTDLPFDLLLSFATKKSDFEKQGWHSIWSDEHCYLTLKEDAKVSDIESRMPAFVKKYLGDDNRDNQTFMLQPLSTFHFDERFGNYNYNTVSKSMLLALSVIAVFLILTACINFINLATADAIKRSKEVGIRKSLGSTRRQLILQFLGETTLITTLAVLMAFGVAYLALGFINSFLNLKLSLSPADPVVAVFLLGITFVVSLLSGLYPSLVISGYQPALALKNKISNKNSSGFMFRRGLVVFQFFISQLLIIGTLVLITQMNYFRNKDLGFRKDAIISVPVPVREEPSAADSSKASTMRTLRTEISRISGVEMTSLANAAPSSGMVMGTSLSLEGDDKFYETQVKTIDNNYIPLYELKLIAGKNIADADTAQGFIVNEKLATMVGYRNPADVVGKIAKVWGKRLPIVGVVRDFHTVSLRSPIEATVMMNRIRNYGSLAIRISPLHQQETIKEIQKKWEMLYPDFIFSYQFLDESIRQFYENENRTSTLLTGFTSLAIFIGCLGLFGLASFMANQKTKEIGIRKVMGASVQSIILLFSKEFVVLIVIGFIIATPFAWYLANQWLNQFAYKINVGPIIFVAGLIVTFVIAIATVGYRSLKAAMTNPVNSLKYE